MTDHQRAAVDRATTYIQTIIDRGFDLHSALEGIVTRWQEMTPNRRKILGDLDPELAQAIIRAEQTFRKDT